MQGIFDRLQVALVPELVIITLYARVDSGEQFVKPRFRVTLVLEHLRFFAAY
jgi:hypothetical protein